MVSPAVNIISYVTGMNFLQDSLNNFNLTLGTAHHNNQQRRSELDHMLFWHNVFIYFVIEFCIMFSAKCHSSSISIFLSFWTILWSFMVSLAISVANFFYIYIHFLYSIIWNILYKRGNWWGCCFFFFS